MLEPTTTFKDVRFSVDGDELAATPSPRVEIEREIMHRRAVQFLHQPLHRGMDDFLEEYRRADLARLQGNSHDIAR